MRKFIILEVGKPPQFEGGWTIGEAMAMLRAALDWLGRLPLLSKPKDQNDKEINNG